MNASTTVLRFDAIFIFYNKCCSSKLRGRLARWRFQRGNYWRWIAVSINHEQRQVMCVFWGIVVSNCRTNSKFEKRHGCSFRGLHSAVATVQINRWQASTAADNLCVGSLLCHSSSTLDISICRQISGSRGTVMQSTHTHTHQTHLFEPVKSVHIH